MRFFCFATICFILISCGNIHAVASKSAGKVRYIRFGGKKYVYLDDVAKYYGMKCWTGKSRCSIASKYSRLVFTYDKNAGFINGEKVYFFHPPFLKGKKALISEVDFIKFIDPVLRSHAVPKHKIGTVMIDAGHGGTDEGGKGRLYREKDIVLRMAVKVKYYLQKKGYKVVLTRSDDRFITLQKRPLLIAKYKADVFVSIHNNIARDKNVNGIETFALPPAGVKSTHGSNNNGWESGNKFDKNNSRLGYEIHRSLSKATGASDRGFKRARFYVLKKATCPSVLVEAGFLSNKYEEKKLGKNDYQNKVARAIAEGVYRYHRSMVRR